LLKSEREIPIEAAEATMEVCENTTNTMYSPSPRRRQTTAGSCESEKSMTKINMALPSPRRIPLRALSKNSLDELQVPGETEVAKNGQTNMSNKEGSSTPSHAASKTPPKAHGHYNRVPKPRTPSSAAMSRTPNAGKFLSPLPLQPRTFHAANKKQVKIDMDDVIFRDMDNENQKPIRDIDDDTGGIFNEHPEQMTECDNNLYDLKLSNAFDEGDDDLDRDDESYGGIYCLEDFKYIRKLGCGGTADVYEVLELDSCALYALKVQKATEDALCELDLHIPLRHANVCQMIDYFYSTVKPFAEMDHDVVSREKADASEGDGDNDARYLCTILEICDGGDLADFVDNHEMMTEKLAAKYMMDAINALMYLHSRNTIHCDIKPANWLVNGKDEDAVVKLADFGMAVTNDSKEIVGGSPVYMAPEHLLAWRDMTDNFDHRTDIYSLGVVLYELLMGYLPYEVLEAKPKQNETSESKDDGIESVAEALLTLSVADGETEAEPTKSSKDDGGYPVLDLRKLDDTSSVEPFYIPPPIFVEEVTEEAQDLILRLMEPSASKRITLEEAKRHQWFQKFL